MKCCRGILFNAECSTHLDCETAHEAGVPVVNEGFGESYTFKHVFQIQFGNSFSRYRFVAWDKDYHFCAVVVRNHEYQVIAIRRW